MNAWRAVSVLALVLCGNPLAAQTPFRAEGRVRSAAGTPIAGATIEADTLRVETDSMGRFRIGLRAADSTTITIRSLGYEPVTFTMATDSLALQLLEIELEPVARTLNELTVTAPRTAHVPTLERFGERRDQMRGIGFFLTREEILRREGARLTSLLSQARGVLIQPQGNGRAVLRMSRSMPRLRPCAPQIWLDGVVVPSVEVDDIPSRDVEAVEVYPSAAGAPSEFSSAAALGCGVVAIWTRRPILKSR